jgi:hypothetical protein
MTCMAAMLLVLKMVIDDGGDVSHELPWQSSMAHLTGHTCHHHLSSITIGGIKVLNVKVSESAFTGRAFANLDGKRCTCVLTNCCFNAFQHTNLTTRANSYRARLLEAMQGSSPILTSLLGSTHRLESVVLNFFLGGSASRLRIYWESGNAGTVSI